MGTCLMASFSFKHCLHSILFWFFFLLLLSGKQSFRVCKVNTVSETPRGKFSAMVGLYHGSELHVCQDSRGQGWNVCCKGFKGSHA